MRVICPSCSAAYEVPDALLSAGRTVRCARCGEEWVAGAPAEEPEPPPPERAVPEPPDQYADPERFAPHLSAQAEMRRTASTRHGNFGLQAAWAASIAVLLVLGWSAYAWRSEVMQTWPASTWLYAALGLGSPGR